jgi:hypothetical protein
MGEHTKEEMALFRGGIEGYLENSTSSGEITQAHALKAWRIVEKEFKRLTWNCEALAKEVADKTLELQTLRAQKQTETSNWQKEIMFVPDEEDLAVHALIPTGEVVEIGFAYVDEDQPTFANSARPCDITPSYLRSLAGGLEWMKRTLPGERPKRLK